MRKKQHLTIEDIPLPVEEAHFVLEYCKDLDIARASSACGIEHEKAYELRQRPDINMQIQRILQSQLSITDITPDWLMQEIYYVHLLSLQTGKLNTSLQALKLIGALGRVDAYAPEKVELKGDRDVVERLMRVRKRNLENMKSEKIVKFDGDEKVTFK